MSLKESSSVCSPIRTLSDLLNLSSSSRLINRLKCSQLVSRYTSPRQKILLCHDMKGGYLEDKYVGTTFIAGYVHSIVDIRKVVKLMNLVIDFFVGISLICLFISRMNSWLYHRWFGSIVPIKMVFKSLVVRFCDIHSFRIVDF